MKRRSFCIAVFFVFLLACSATAGQNGMVCCNRYAASQTRAGLGGTLSAIV